MIIILPLNCFSIIYTIKGNYIQKSSAVYSRCQLIRFFMFLQIKLFYFFCNVFSWFHVKALQLFSYTKQGCRIDCQCQSNITMCTDTLHIPQVKPAEVPPRKITAPVLNENRRRGKSGTFFCPLKRLSELNHGNPESTTLSATLAEARWQKKLSYLVGQ